MGWDTVAVVALALLAAAAVWIIHLARINKALLQNLDGIIGRIEARVEDLQHREESLDEALRIVRATRDEVASGRRRHLSTVRDRGPVVAIIAGSVAAVRRTAETHPVASIAALSAVGGALLLPPVISSWPDTTPNQPPVTAPTSTASPSPTGSPSPSGPSPSATGTSPTTSHSPAPTGEPALPPAAARPGFTEPARPGTAAGAGKPQPPSDPQPPGEPPDEDEPPDGNEPPDGEPDPPAEDHLLCIQLRTQSVIDVDVCIL